MQVHAILAAAMIPVMLTAEGVKQPESTLAEVDKAIGRGVDFLVSHQNPNGSWGGPTKTKDLIIYAPVPGAHAAFRAGASGLALSGLIDSADARPEARRAVESAASWTREYLPRLRRADQTTTYNCWGHAYGMRAIVRLHRIAKTEGERKQLKELAQEQVDLVNRYADVNGGWGYLDLRDGLTTQKPTGIPTPFTTATVLLAMHEAQEELGVKLDPKIVSDAVRLLRLTRTPDFSYVYSFSHRYRPRWIINRPAGSLGRSQACNAAMHAFGDGLITHEVIEEWADRFLNREGFLDMTRKRPIPHEGPFLIAGYFYYYGIFYFTESVRLLPKEQQHAYAAKLAAMVLSHQEKDGSWWDYPLYDYHQAYGTGYALMALAWCREHLTTE